MVRTKTVPLLPPQYLMETEEVPVPPEKATPEQRMDFTLEAYGERGEAIKRGNHRAEILRKWVEAVREVYDDAAHKSLKEVKALKQKPQ